MFSRNGPRASYDSRAPPGMMLGPLSAPSSPPEMPAPTKCSPCWRSAASRRRVSSKCAFPPSTTMSPSSRCGTSSSITASVGAPALTMMMTRRGRSRLSTSSSIEDAGRKLPSSPCSFMSRSVLAWVRLKRATVCPRLAKLRARLLPMTANPITPTCACSALWVLTVLPPVCWTCTGVRRPVLSDPTPRVSGASRGEASRERREPGDLAAEDQRLDGLGALVGVHELHVGQVAGDVVPEQQAVAAEDVPGLGADGPRLAGVVHLGHGCHRAGQPALHLELCHAACAASQYWVDPGMISTPVNARAFPRRAPSSPVSRSSSW